ncbi:LysR substrate-binding domain-containing protein [Nonomuraea turcica]|uniref:LysR substrate-binding domain-containing protein n=1 Tax=Nonomuraea sp. G32 TaxID=3067274 RepID=UPI00273BAB65|nr:LysR substrate-binding domain-containing protein [Nonomuraea sp. G32]MDP4511343.1 LysR substrate-binding domain-containing protein [Nonomuraea sp. G32]
MHTHAHSNTTSLDPSRAPVVELEDLLDDPLHLALPEKASEERESSTASLRALAARPWAMEPEGTAARRGSMTLCRNAGFEPDVRFETTDLLLQLRLVEQGHAVALLPDLVWNGRSPTVTLQELPRGQRTRRIFTAVRQGRSRHPAIRAARRALQHARMELAGRTGA